MNTSVHQSSEKPPTHWETLIQYDPSLSEEGVQEIAAEIEACYGSKIRLILTNEIE